MYLSLFRFALYQVSRKSAISNHLLKHMQFFTVLEGLVFQIPNVFAGLFAHSFLCVVGRVPAVSFKDLVK